MASFWARYQFPAGISLGAGVRYIGKQWADDANTARLPSVTLMDAMMREMCIRDRSRIVPPG